SIAEIKANALSLVSDRLTTFAARTGSVGKIQIREDEDSITVSLADDLLFGSGSAALRPGSQDVLLEIAALLNELPNHVQVEGHTDNVPVNSDEFATNWELSAARATTVLRFLADEGQVAEDRLSAVAFADTQPLGDNTTPEGRALNRRADI